jgi:hypothetical protein
MQYGKTGNSEQKFITEEAVPQKFQIFVSNSEKLQFTFLVFKGQTNSDWKRVKRSIFRVLLPRNFSRAALH